MRFFTEFKDFALKGNVLDLAIGVIIGGAFNKIVTSLVDDVLTPLIFAPALKSANLENLAELTLPGTAVKYGNFLSTLISFLIIAICLFLIVKSINKLKNKKEDIPAPSGPTQEELLAEIRDLLKEKK